MTDTTESTTPFFGANAVFIEELYERYLQNPSNVDESWRDYFGSIRQGADNPRTIASWSGVRKQVIGAIGEEELAIRAAKAKKAGKGGGASTEQMEQFAHNAIRAGMMIRAYRVRGHLNAKLDPLELEQREYHPELDPKTYGFTEEDMDLEIFLNGVLGKERATLREIVAILRGTYCSHIGVEFMHIQFGDQKSWIQKKIEGAHGRFEFSVEEKKEILNTLVEVESFEQFLTVKYPGTKRFSIQGGDATLPGLQAIMRRSAKMGVQEFVFGMPHRGRINVMTTILGKPYAEMLSLFHGNLNFPEWVSSSGDVKYHLGTSTDQNIAGRDVHMSLLSNPSHLEAVNSVVAGKVRAKLDTLGDIEHKDKAMGITLHGDAAFAGQGSVAEVLSLSELKGYRTGGTIHVIVNNQIGFTTDPKSSRFTPYPSDVAKMVQAPIFHVNGDDPEAVYWACDMAAEFRQLFKRDVVIDIFCYRKFGHNESDEPSFTQPIMYKKIKAHKLPAEIYADRLVREGVMSEAEVTAKFADFKEFFEKEYEVAKAFKPNKADWLEGAWSGFKQGEDDPEKADTGVELDRLKEVGTAISKVPENFKVNSKIVRQLDAKRTMIETGEGIDWATAEALAFGTLLKDDIGVRLSGQDCERGTFSQRHSVLIDQDNENRYVPLNNLGEQKEQYEVLNSSLSEFAILGFEYGYSLGYPNQLTLWEAQFGDFVNGAQTIIDQFITSGEAKWLRMSGLVMLLPHGYEGQGPEHSSARLERFLQSCAENNVQVANCTTPANYFHILRRQICRNFRKPLILMTPKSLLRHKLCVSKLDDFTAQTTFKRVIPETNNLVKDADVRRVVLTSGKVYYDLFEAREKENINDVAIIRTEQYYPFPEKELKEQLAKYKNAEVVWCQEEPKNMGAWSFMASLIDELLEDMNHNCRRVRYVGRKAAASPAAGYLSIHNQEQAALVSDALTIEQTAKKKRA